MPDTLQTTPKVIGCYKVGAEIGRGSFANVYKGINLQKHEAVAIKSVSRSLLKNKKLLENLEIEISILKDLKHPQIVELLDYQQTDQHFHLIMEYCSLGDLSFFIRRKDELIQKHPLIKTMFNKYPTPKVEKFNGLNKILVLNYLKQLSSALKFLRSKNLVHRDIKPQNLLLAPPIFDQDKFNEMGFVGLADLPILKIADFGFARFLPNTSLAETLCGSPLYMAPEILNYQKYTAKADLWSVGAVVYEMSVGKPPFKAANHLELLNKIKRTKDRIHFPSAIQEYIDPQIKRLICSLLKFEPTERMGFNEFFEDDVVNYDLKVLLNEVDEKICLEPSQVNENLFISEYIQKGPIINDTVNQDDDVAHPASQSPTPAPEETIARVPVQGTETKIQQITKRDIQPMNPSKNMVSLQKSNPSGFKLNYQLDSKRKASLNRSDVVVEKEYVVVEKTAVEVNALADELAQTGTGIGAIALPANARRGSRTSSGGSNGVAMGRRPSFEARRISISLSPTNALSKALGLASTRLFGGNNPQQMSVAPQVPNPPVSNSNSLINDLMTNPNNQLLSSRRNSDFYKMGIVEQLENLATKAHVINLFAEVKFSQLIPSPPSVNSYAIEDDEDDEDDLLSSDDNGLPPEVVKVLAGEAVLLYVKTLSLLSKAMNLASEWWHKNSDSPPFRLNELVQWIRERFNECLGKAEFVKLKLHDADKRLYEKDENFLSKFPHIYSERLIYDRALEIAKNTAKMEMSSAQTAENLIGCELAYTTSVWMLEALLEESDDGGSLEEGDRDMILKYVDSIIARLTGLRKKLGGE